MAGAGNGQPRECAPFGASLCIGWGQGWGLATPHGFQLVEVVRVRFLHGQEGYLGQRGGRQAISSWPKVIGYTRGDRDPSS